MERTAFIFPGQGAQYVGMAREFYDTYEVSRRVFSEASQAAGFSMEELCFTENERIHETRFTQPALLTACCAILRAVWQEGLSAGMTAGLSLGEYCALTAAGVLDFADAVRIVCSRGIYMEEAVPCGLGTMAAVISRKELPIEEICRETEGIVTVANYNCPGQRVISGETKAVEEAAGKLREAGAARVVPLTVSGPFHSPMLREAGAKLEMLLQKTELKRPGIPFVSNVTAEEVSEPEMIRRLLGKQVSSPVRWEQSMRYMMQNGADTFVEIGPGKTLSNFARKIDRSLRVYHVETVEDLRQLKKEPAAVQE